MEISTSNNKPEWAKLLTEAVLKPGKLLEAYRAFHNYSFGNILLAMVQCQTRQIPMGPLSTFEAWKTKGRFVKRGEKAIVLCRPLTFKVKDDDGNEKVMARFKYEARWFVLEQTDGKPYELPAMQWDKTKALTELKIEEISFRHPDGNTQGYATENKLAINPLAQLPAKTMFHEMAHIVLGHTQAENYKSHEGETLPVNEMEVEAESVAMLCVASLDLPGVEYCRGYIQNWMKGSKYTDAMASRIMGAADKILRAGLITETKVLSEVA